MAGATILVGGLGAGTLKAAAGGAILISGTTTASLNAALAGWARPDLCYTGRVHHVLGQLSGRNSTTFLTASTVYDHGSRDSLLGGSVGRLVLRPRHPGRLGQQDRR